LCKITGNLNHSAVLFLDNYNDRFSSRHQQEERNYHDGSGYRHSARGRTFYSRRTPYIVSETSACNTMGQQQLTESCLNQNGDTSYEGSWQDRQMKGRATLACSEKCNRNVSLQNNWQEQNGYSSDHDITGNKTHVYNASGRPAKTTSPDLSDYESDQLHSTSTESTHFSPSTYSNSSIVSSTFVPSSPNTCEGRYFF